MKLNRIDHIGVVVDNIEEATALLGQGFGLEAGPTIQRKDLASRKICLCLLHQTTLLEVISNFVTISPPGSCTFAQRTEVVILRSLRQIVREAGGGAVVVLAEQFRIPLTSSARI